jgi:hypothetical protein
LARLALDQGDDGNIGGKLDRQRLAVPRFDHQIPAVELIDRAADAGRRGGGRGLGKSGPNRQSNEGGNGNSLRSSLLLEETAKTASPLEGDGFEPSVPLNGERARPRKSLISPVERSGIEMLVPGAESITKRNRVLREDCPPNQFKNNAAALL